MLVGNKNDLADERVVSAEEGRQLAASMHADFMEISAKNHNDVTAMFNTLVSSIDKDDKPSSNCTIS